MSDDITKRLIVTKNCVKKEKNIRMQYKEWSRKWKSVSKEVKTKGIYFSFKYVKTFMKTIDCKIWQFAIYLVTKPNINSK